ncbi:MAG: hypothetical protein J2P57_24820, partial [Acidimicrobiaceae bacterium]|nr:hypothetical protein [Acidimicrobiaceae bacterium]
MARRALTTESSFADAVDAWLVNLGAAKPSAATLAAYRRDLHGVAARLAEPDGAETLRLPDLSR